MLLQQCLNGLILGSIYALFSLGFSLIFGTQRILNLAHGAVFMFGAFAGVYGVEIGLPLWLAVLFAMGLSGLVSVLLEWLAFRPLRGSKDFEFSAMLSSFGANMVMISLAQKWSNTEVHRFPSGTFPIEFFRALGLRISLLQITILAIVTGMLALLAYIINRTSMGRQIRAVTANERAARLLGVEPNRVYVFTFFIAGVFAGLAGVLIGLSFNSIEFMMGQPFLLRAFVVVVLGGLGSTFGAVIGGILLGLIETLSIAYMPSGTSEIIIYAILFLTLLVRPSGLLGRPAQANMRSIRA